MASHSFTHTHSRKQDPSLEIMRSTLVLFLHTICFVIMGKSDLTLTQTEQQTGLVDRHREALIGLASETNSVFVIRVTDPTASLSFFHSVFTLTSLARYHDIHTNTLSLSLSHTHTHRVRNWSKPTCTGRKGWMCMIRVRTGDQWLDSYRPIRFSTNSPEI